MRTVNDQRDSHDSQLGQPRVDVPQSQIPTLPAGLPQSSGATQRVDVQAPVVHAGTHALAEDREPDTWAGASFDLPSLDEHRPVSSLDKDPTHKKWMLGALGGAVVLTAILMAIVGSSSSEAADEAAEPIPEADPVAEVAPVEEPPAPVEPAKTDARSSKKKTSKTAAKAKADTTLAAASKTSASMSSEPSKASSSKPTASKPTASKPAAPSTPEPSEKASRPALAPPDEAPSGGEASLPDVSGWDDADSAVGDRDAELPEG